MNDKEQIKSVESDRAADEVFSRRGMLRWMAGVFLSLWAFGAFWVAAGFLMAPGAEEHAMGQMISVGEVASLSPGDARLIHHRSQPILVIRDLSGEVAALSAICTHMRCVLHWDSQAQVIRCPCHGGTFDVDGNVLSGPPPRPLARFVLEVRLGEIFVHV